MRRPLLVLALVSMTACTAKGTTMNAEALHDIGTRYTAAWNSDDPDRVAARYAEGGSLKVNGAEPAVGREAIAAVARGFMTAFPDMVLVMDSVRRRDDGTVEYDWTFVGTNTGPGGTGAAVRFSGSETWTLTGDGSIAVSIGRFDEAEYERQLAAGVEEP